jgi:glycogen debranching enzyme
VEPRFTFGDSDVPLSLDCIQCITVLPKLLGPFPEWEGRLKVIKESGYNMIHFAPVQELGKSRSGYSLANQHRLNPDFGENFTMQDLGAFVKKIEKEWKVSIF